jgi:hypothetical protein
VLRESLITTMLFVMKVFCILFAALAPNALVGLKAAGT